MPKLTRRHWLTFAAVLASTPLFGGRLQAEDEADAAGAAAKGREFLVSLLDAELDLLPEYRGARVYWLYHDNYLAAKVLKQGHPDIAQRIERAISSHGVTKSGKIEILFGEAEKPLPFRQFELTEVKRIGRNVLKTEVAGEEPLVGWEQYADLLLLAAIASAESQPEEAKRHFNSAMALWDGHGLADQATRAHGKYATYKLALALIAVGKLKTKLAEHEAVVKKLLAQQAEAGGWITDYDEKGRRLGLANVETTSMAILALDQEAPASVK
jgi:hypothetical protein